MESFSEELSERDEEDDWLEDSEEIEAIDKLLKKDEELKKLTAITLYKPQTSQISSELTDPPDLGQLSVINPSSVSPSIHNALVLNKACQALLIQLEKKLEGLLEENLKKQRDLEKYINSNRKDSYLSSNFVIKCLGMPYFKDLDGFLPPRNCDVSAKILNDELLPEDLATNSRIWSLKDHDELKKSVINHVKDLKCKELSKKENDLKRAGKINVNDYKAVIEEINAVKNAPEERLDINPRKIDWLKISAQDMRGLFSETECESKWVLELDPKLNKTKWSSEEFKSLVKVAEKYGFQNWDAIAENLETNRSGFQCCVQFHSKKRFQEGKWTEEEIARLRELYNKYKMKDYVPWLKIAWYFDTRSVKRVKEKFQSGIMRYKRKGRFNKIEDSMIVIAAKEFSSDFTKINKCLPDRNVKQIRSRFDYLVGKYMPPFTKEEEGKLIDLVNKYSKNWKVISEHFENRSSLQCRKYWEVIQKSIQENELDEDDDWNWNELLPESKTSYEITDSDVSLVDKIKLINRQEKDVADRSAAYVLLLNYLHTCHEFLFGPRSRNISDPDEATMLVHKTEIAMETLRVNQPVLVENEEEESDSRSHSILNAEEEGILYHLQMNRVAQEGGNIYMDNSLIPPNYTTMVGLRSLVLGRTAIQNFATNVIPDRTGHFENRLTFNDAKELWKSRLKILFTLPVVCSKIDLVPEKEFRKGRIIKPKPLSQRKKRAHALYLTEAKKLKRSLLSEDDIVFAPEEDKTDSKKPKKKLAKVLHVEPNKKRGRPNKNPVVDDANKEVRQMEVRKTYPVGVRRTERAKKIPDKFVDEAV